MMPIHHLKINHPFTFNSLGVLVVFSVGLVEKMKWDDCVGAVSVLLTCGMFGAKAGMEQFGNQLIGVLACGVVVFLFSLIIFKILKAVKVLRVSEEHEIEGMDSHEHGIRGYTIFYDA